MTWTATAELLADTDELARAAAACQSAAWAAGTDPAACKGITGAALALGAPPAALMAQAAPFGTDRAMVAAAEHLAAGVAERAARADDCRRGAAIALDAAQAALARAMSARPPDDGAAAGAMARIADCETALEVLAPLRLRLGYALARLGEVPGDLAETYAAAQRHVQAGRQLPYDGRWLTGARP